MIQIHKQKEPNSLTEHRAKEKADYDNYPKKGEVRKSLRDEQRGICCYCLGPIESEINSIKIEHFQCQAFFPDMQLDYRNMLGACMGNEGQPREKQHCDSFKANDTLVFNPANSTFAIQNIIEYGSDGTIRSTNATFNEQLSDVLNLNVVHLKSNRKAALDGFITLVVKKHKSNFGKDILERWLNNWNGATHRGVLRPYNQVVVYWLQRKINQA